MDQHEKANMSAMGILQNVAVVQTPIGESTLLHMATILEPESRKKNTATDTNKENPLIAQL